jgi:tetratricopeptide (TPR) repeat protein
MSCNRLWLRAISIIELGEIIAVSWRSISLGFTAICWMISIPWAIYDWHNGQVPFEAISGFLLGLAALMGYFYGPNQTITAPQKSEVNMSRSISASNAGVAVGRNVINSEIHTHIHPPGAPKPKSLSYQPPKPPKPGDIPDHGDLPPGSRMTFLQNAVFTGRHDDLIELGRYLLYSHDESGVVVSGMGGLGKSQLAVEFCYRYGRFFRGVHWIQANLDMQAEIAENGLAMGLPYWPDKLPEQVQATLKVWQEEGGQRLIVLDNAEDLQVLQNWLPKLQSARLLITSRRENWPIDMGLNVKKLEVLARSQSIELLCKLAARLKEMPDEQLDNLADFLGDLPLALDLAGWYLADRPELPVEGYLAELEAGSALEHTSLRDWAEHSPTGHLTSLAATFALSWERLTEGDELAKQLFKIGGYCAPNMPIPRQILAKAMGTDVPDHELDRALRKLESLGLMDSSEGSRRMHSLLAEFARLQDRDSDESVLPDLAEAMAEITTEAIESGLPENMRPLHEHLDFVARSAEESNLQSSGALWNNLGVNLKDLADYEGAKRILERALKIDENAYGPDHPNVARDVNNIGMVLQDLGDLQEARKCYERALKIDQKADGSDHPNVARDVNNIGSVLKDLGDLQEARKCYERALKIDEKAYGPDHPNVAIRVNNIGLVLKDLGDLQEARKYLERALKIDEKAYGPDHPNVAIRVNNIGLVLQAQGDLQEARKCFERALKIDEKAYGSDHPNVARDVNNIGLVLQYQGDLQEARKCFERALKIGEKAYGPDHLNVATMANNIGLVLQAQGDLQEARKCYERALKIDEKAYGPDHPNVARDVNNIGTAMQYQGDLQKARECFERALKIDEKAYGPDHPNVARDVNNIGMVLQAQGDLQEARKCYERALKIDEKAYGPDHPNVAIDVNNIGSVLKAQGDLQEARKCYERALKIDENAYGPDHPDVARDVNNLGSVLQAQGDLQEARECFERALKICRDKFGPDHPNTRTVADNLSSLGQGQK